MLRRVIERFGVDYTQWRALLRAYVMLDYAELLGAYGARAARHAAVRLALLCALVAIMTSEAALLAWLADDTWMAATVMTTQTAALVGLVVLMHASTIVSPDDYAIIGFRPISARTYLGVRLSAIFIHTVEAAALAASVPVIVWFAKPAGSLTQALAVVAATAGTAFGVTLAIVAVHGWLLRHVAPVRMPRILAVTSGVLALLLMGMFSGVWIFMVNALTGAAGTFRVTWTLPRVWWVLAWPPAWFGAYPAIVRGTAGPYEWAAGGLSVLTLVGFGWAVRGRLTAEFAVRAAERTLDAPLPMRAAPEDPHRTLLAGEGRAIALLLWHTVRGDVMMQMNLIMSLVTGACFLGFTGIVGWPADPFAASMPARNDGAMLMFAATFLPISFRQTLVTSQQAAGSWLFFTTPADRVRLLITTRRIVAAVVLVPAMATVVGVSVYAYGHLGHALLNGLFIGLVSYLLLQLGDWLDPRLPFSTPVVPTTGRKLPFKPAMVGISLIGLPVQILLMYVAYRSWMGIGAALLLLVAVIGWTERGAHRRLRRRCERVRYEC